MVKQELQQQQQQQRNNYNKIFAYGILMDDRQPIYMQLLVTMFSCYASTLRPFVVCLSQRICEIRRRMRQHQEFGVIHFHGPSNNSVEWTSDRVNKKNHVKNEFMLFVNCTNAMISHFSNRFVCYWNEDKTVRLKNFQTLKEKCKRSHKKGNFLL